MLRARLRSPARQTWCLPLVLEGGDTLSEIISQHYLTYVRLHGQHFPPLRILTQSCLASSRVSHPMSHSNVQKARPTLATPPLILVSSTEIILQPIADVRDMELFGPMRRLLPMGMFQPQ